MSVGGVGAEAVMLPVGDEGEGTAASTAVPRLVLRLRGKRADLAYLTGTRFAA